MSQPTAALKRLRAGEVGKPFVGIVCEGARFARAIAGGGNDRAGGGLGRREREKDALAGERIEEAGGIADQHGAVRDRRAHAMRQRPDRRARADAVRVRKRTVSAPELGRFAGHAFVDESRPRCERGFRYDDHHVGRILAQRVEGEISARADVHLDEAAEIAEAGVMSADGKSRRTPAVLHQAGLPRDDRSAAVGADGPARAHFVRATVVVAHPHAVDASAIAQQVLDAAVHDGDAGIHGRA